MKKRRMSYRNTKGSRDEQPISTIHMDTNGPTKTMGAYGSHGTIKYFQSIIDDNTSWRWTYVLRSKKEVFEKVEEILLQLEREGKFTIRRIRSDDGTEFANAAFKNFCKGKGDVFQTSNAYSPEENGAAEWDHQSKLDRVRCALKDADMVHKWWPEALMYMTYVQNRTPMRRLGYKTPYEMGSVCFAHIPAALRKDKKLSARAVKCRFLGISEDTKGYWLCDTYNNKHLISRDVLFDTTNPQWSNELSDKPKKLSQPNLPRESHPQQKKQTHLPVEPRPRREAKKSKRYQDYQCIQAMLDKNVAQDILEHKVPTPRSLKQALSGPHREQWKQALELEYDSLIENGTWRLVRLPPGRKALPCHWVLVVKYKADGTVERFKAHKVTTKDCDVVYAPVAQLESLRLVLAIGTILDCHIHQMDVHTAFLNGTMEGWQKLYMRQPHGFMKRGHGHLVCELQKSIYGLKQAPRIWYRVLHHKEFCIYVQNVGEEWLIVVVSVDDLTIMSRNMRLIHRMKAELSNRFKNEDIGDIHYILKMELQHNREQRVMMVSQRKYIVELITTYKMVDSAPVMTPQVAGLTLEPDMKMSAQQIAAQPYDYRGIVGSLQYLVRGTRPDIANAVRELSKFLSCYNRTHWDEARRVLKYLKGTSTYGLFFDGKMRDVTYEVYTDASFACQSKERKSVTGYVVKMVGTSVSWCSTKQGGVSLSTAEAELIALSE
ncbi:LOW QUALITY PROTEIN: Integrase catalytic core protein [Phytophthora palmivora]|uniref:Integrase catalytic core protein n=1 Tax=Phytophthora palmivora TaxID=4796 RepID=A0A2P4XUY2_9STRA|nr:LOW QUALITY PROTEIN: Integrase catalytic core protein [Phytophthora palmivora]